MFLIVFQTVVNFIFDVIMQWVLFAMNIVACVPDSQPVWGSGTQAMNIADSFLGLCGTFQREWL